MPYGLLARRIQTCAPPTARAGAIALIGPPGSGKTTTLAKLAARYVLEQDAANLLIISTDDERLGSHEQLACLGRLLGVRVETVIGEAALAVRIAALPGRCILIDTPGVAGRDAKAAEGYRALRERCPELTALLVLPASAQAGVIEDTVMHFGPPLADCCALTRIDEAVSLGGVLSALARCRLPVAYACEGPRIPEDLRPARAHQLVARAVELARGTQDRADDDLLARRYGRSVHAAA
jgi:flagellar biosynthesis protein FlhF